MSQEPRKRTWAENARIDLTGLDLAGARIQGGTLSLRLLVVKGRADQFLRILDYRQDVITRASKMILVLKVSQDNADALGISPDELEKRKASAEKEFMEAFCQPARVELASGMGEKGYFEDLVLEEPQGGRGEMLLTCFRFEVPNSAEYFERRSRGSNSLYRSYRSCRLVVTCTSRRAMYSILLVADNEDGESCHQVQTKFLAGSELTITRRELDETAESIASRQQAEAKEGPKEAEDREEAEVVDEPPKVQEKKTTRKKRAVAGSKETGESDD